MHGPSHGPMHLAALLQTGVMERCVRVEDDAALELCLRLWEHSSTGGAITFLAGAECADVPTTPPPAVFPVPSPRAPAATLTAATSVPPAPEARGAAVAPPAPRPRPAPAATAAVASPAAGPPAAVLDLSPPPSTAVVVSDDHVSEPLSGAFDATVAPGENLAAALMRVRRGGSVLLLPGAHAGPLVLAAVQEVHVFGRGQARLLAPEGGGEALVSAAECATVDGLVITGDAASSSSAPRPAVWVKGGRLRLHACDVSNASGACVAISDGADPGIVDCKCVEMREGEGGILRSFFRNGWRAVR